MSQGTEHSVTTLTKRTRLPVSPACGYWRHHRRQACRTRKIAWRGNREKLQRDLKSLEIVSEVRGLGLLIGVELDQSIPNFGELAEQIMYECLDAGLSFKFQWAMF